MPDFTIITAVAEDLPEVPLIYEADGYDGAAQLMRHGAASELVEFTNGDRVLYLADAGGITVGTAGLIFRGQAAGLADGLTSANINRLHVVQAWRKRGVATALMDVAEREACARGFVSLTIEVEDDNTPARALYEKLGFSYSGRGKDPVNVAMTKALD
jgi:ribosomal-protein-alanine N-acetyltransferase